MKTRDILELDFNSEENKLKIQKLLLKTNWFKGLKPEELTDELLEKTVSKMYIKDKCPFKLNYLIESRKPDKYVCLVYHSKTNTLIKKIYFTSVFELAAKTLIIVFAYYKKGVRFVER